MSSNNNYDLNSSIIKYPNNTAILLGNLKIDDKWVDKNCIIFFFVGNELRGKTNIINYNNESWFNLSVQSSGATEKGKVIILESSNKIIEYEEIIINSGESVGNIKNPYIINVYNEVKSKPVDILFYKTAVINLKVNSDIEDIKYLQVNEDIKKKLYVVDKKLFNNINLTISFNSDVSKEISFILVTNKRIHKHFKVLKIIPGEVFGNKLNPIELNFFKINSNNSMVCFNCQKVITSKSNNICPSCNLDFEKFNIDKISKTILSLNDEIYKNKNIIINKNDQKKNFADERKKNNTLFIQTTNKFINKIDDIKILIKMGVSGLDTSKYYSYIETWNNNETKSIEEYEINIKKLENDIKSLEYNNVNLSNFKADLNKLIDVTQIFNEGDLSELHEDHVEESNHHDNHVEEPTHQENHVEEPTHQENHVEESTHHDNHVEESTHQENHVEESTHHDNHVEEIIYNSQIEETIDIINNSDMLDLLYLEQYKYNNPLETFPSVPTIIILRPKVNGNFLESNYLIEFYSKNCVRGRSKITDKSLIAIPISTESNNDIVTASIFYKNKWISSSSELKLNFGKVYGTAKSPIIFNFGESNSIIYDVDTSFNNNLDHNEIENDQLITIFTKNIENKHQFVDIVLNDVNYSGEIIENKSQIIIPKDNLDNLKENKYDLIVNCSNNYGNKPLKKIVQFTIDLSLKPNNEGISHIDTSDMSSVLIPSILLGRVMINSRSLGSNDRLYIYVENELRSIPQIITTNNISYFSSIVSMKKLKETVRFELFDHSTNSILKVRDNSIIVTSGNKIGDFKDPIIVNGVTIFGLTYNLEMNTNIPTKFIAEVIKFNKKCSNLDTIGIYSDEKLISEQNIKLYNNKSYIVSILNLDQSKQIKFKLYDNETKSIIDFDQNPIELVPGLHVGTFQSPFVISIDRDKEDNICSTELIDCNNDCRGDLIHDECGVCAGNNSTCIDCFGIPNGTAIIDECGICDGGNESCLDCNGVPNGSSLLDLCGICNGDNSTCKDCNGIPNGDSILDECGVCDGDNSSCKDCNGVPNGQSLIDECGICDGNNSTCKDCLGIINGSALIDECGVCNGNNSTCLDCNGVPNGDSILDKCGVCNGDNSTCTDCFGVINGDALVDECGICNGDNSTCTDCMGIINGKAKLDDCGVCNGDNTTCTDCMGVLNGDAILDDCGVCNGDGNCKLEIELLQFKENILHLKIESEFTSLKKVKVQLFSHIDNTNNPIQNIENKFKDGDKINSFTFRVLENSIKSTLDSKDNMLYYLEISVVNGINIFKIPVNGLFNDKLLFSKIYTAFTVEILNI